MQHLSQAYWEADGFFFKLRLKLPCRVLKRPGMAWASTARRRRFLDKKVLSCSLLTSWDSCSTASQAFLMRVMEIISLVRRPSGPMTVRVRGVEEPYIPVSTAADDDVTDVSPAFNYLEDIAQHSYCESVLQLLASHLHRASGACRGLRQDIVLWSSLSYSKIKTCEDMTSDNVPWLDFDGAEKGSYSLMRTTSNQCWGIAPAFQKLCFSSSTNLQELGLELLYQPSPFNIPGDEPGQEQLIKVLIMRYDQICGGAVRDRLQEFCTLRD